MLESYPISLLCSDTSSAFLLEKLSKMRVITLMPVNGDMTQKQTQQFCRQCNDRCSLDRAPNSNNRFWSVSLLGIEA